MIFDGTVIRGDQEVEEKLFDIPIYVCPIDEYNSYWYKHYESACRRTEDSDEEWAEKLDILKQNNHRKTTWMYQAIIGYIGVYKQEIDLFATLSIDERERKIKGGYPDIYYNPSTFFRIRVEKSMTSDDVMDKFKECIEMEKKTRLKNRYIDIEPFYNFCKYVDWHKVFYSEED